jgi:hypothetical protein
MNASETDRFDMVPVSEWDRLHRSLDDWCRGTVEETGGSLVCETGGARFVVHRDGAVEAGMPLHEFGRDGVDAVGFDYDQRELLVVGDDLRYVFRHP